MPHIAWSTVRVFVPVQRRVLAVRTGMPETPPHYRFRCDDRGRGSYERGEDFTPRRKFPLASCTATAIDLSRKLDRQRRGFLDAPDQERESDSDPWLRVPSLELGGSTLQANTPTRMSTPVAALGSCMRGLQAPPLLMPSPQVSGAAVQVPDGVASPVRVRCQAGGASGSAGHVCGSYPALHCSLPLRSDGCGPWVQSSHPQYWEAASARTSPTPLAKGAVGPRSTPIAQQVTHKAGGQRTHSAPLTSMYRSGCGSAHPSPIQHGNERAQFHEVSCSAAKNDSERRDAIAAAANNVSAAPSGVLTAPTPQRQSSHASYSRTGTPQRRPIVCSAMQSSYEPKVQAASIDMDSSLTHVRPHAANHARRNSLNVPVGSRSATPARCLNTNVRLSGASTPLNSHTGDPRLHKSGLASPTTAGGRAFCAEQCNVVYQAVVRDDV